MAITLICDGNILNTIIIIAKNYFDCSTFGSSIEDPSCDYHLDWKDKPDCILLMKKFRDSTVTSKFKEVARWLIEVCDFY